jgi:hypothetical protein
VQILKKAITSIHGILGSLLYFIFFFFDSTYFQKQVSRKTIRKNVKTFPNDFFRHFIVFLLERGTIPNSSYKIFLHSQQCAFI